MRNGSVNGNVNESRRLTTGNYNTRILHDTLPSPTGQNRKMLVFGNADHPTERAVILAKVPLEGRYVKLRERARIMGFTKPMADLMATTMTAPTMQKAIGKPLI